MNEKSKKIILNLLKFILLNIALYVFCFFIITPHFRSSAYSKMRIEDQNQINYSHYKLNVKSISTREDFIVDKNDGKEIHRNK